METEVTLPTMGTAYGFSGEMEDTEVFYTHSPALLTLPLYSGMISEKIYLACTADQKLVLIFQNMKQFKYYTPAKMEPRFLCLSPIKKG